MNENNKSKTFRLVILGMLIAVMILQNFVPILGYIPFGPLSITIIHVTVIIAAIVLGPRGGAILGGVWGVITFVRAFAAPTSPIAPIIFTNPIISVLPRILVGVLSGWAFILLVNMKMPKTFAAILSAIIGSLTNTILVLGLIFLLYKEPYASFYGIEVNQLMGALLTVVSTNGLFEAIAAAVIVPLISLPLLNRYHK